MPTRYTRNSDISIHVPLAGDDYFFPIGGNEVINFYPRPPCGGRPVGPRDDDSTHRFLSTSPLRGTTCVSCRMKISIEISIHVPLAGDDRRGEKILHSQNNFYPRPPCGGRPIKQPSANDAALFLSTSPLRGTTCALYRSFSTWPTFLSTSPLRGTTSARNLAQRGRFISIHVPLAGDDVVS